MSTQDVVLKNGEIVRDVTPIEVSQEQVAAAGGNRLGASMLELSRQLRVMVDEEQAKRDASTGTNLSW